MGSLVVAVNKDPEAPVFERPSAILPNRQSYYSMINIVNKIWSGPSPL